MRIFRTIMTAGLFLVPATMPILAAESLHPPVGCEPGKDCFLQQMADMTAGPGVSDPFCGTASYDGHTGLDIRLRSLSDIERGVTVLAMADGVVVGMRDGAADHLVATPADRDAVANRECGNGVVIDHGGGVITQYCHLRQGSLKIREGQKVGAGEVLGEVGASGMAQFPHVHAEMRVNNKPVDIITGKPVDGGCDQPPLEGIPRLENGFAAALGTGDAILLDSGLAGSPPDHIQLVQQGTPEMPDTSSSAVLGWAWFANLKKGDRVSVLLTWPDGKTTAFQTSQPMNNNKADYLAFAGRKRVPVPGSYRLEIAVMRDGKALHSFRSSHEVR
ncbi:MAG: M23 family metallopeptidase [Nitratireductor sp.]